MIPVADAAATVPERYYTHNPDRGPTDNRSNPVVIHRELTTLGVAEGMSVLEVGTGSGYSGALLSHIVGPSGRVTSLDIDPYLTRWANLIHHQRGLGNIACHTGDGTAGWLDDAPYDRLVAWCAPPLLPQAWVDQLAVDSVIVTALPIAEVPHLTVVVKLIVGVGGPRVEEVYHGGYIETGTSPRADFDVPLRWVDWENRVPAPSWISTAWREEDDWLRTGARTALERLLKNAYTEPYQGGALDWDSWRTYAAAVGGMHLTAAEVAVDELGLGHSVPGSTAVIREDGTILADAPDSPSLVALRGWLAGWENAGRPAPETYTPALDRDDAAGGWHLRLSR
ncbi:protein-L-isoaspartate O-methyltransferase family protein [Streptomyces mangrovi]|uniref:protein-L-isoaspartate O-methyltransferase family protein n=1 Tax=Streptomyces mangrovi TaxID=1206892 RepID=UPI00399D4FBB